MSSRPPIDALLKPYYSILSEIFGLCCVFSSMASKKLELFQDLMGEKAIPAVPVPAVQLTLEGINLDSDPTGSNSLIEPTATSDSMPFHTSSDEDSIVYRPKQQRREMKETSKPVKHENVVIKDPENRPVGEEAPPNSNFCPILAVSKYPYRFMTATTAIVDEVSRKFFAGNEFWNRTWTL